MLHFQHLRVALGIHDQFFSEKNAKYGETISDLELEIKKDLIQTRPQALCRALALLVGSVYLRLALALVANEINARSRFRALAIESRCCEMLLVVGFSPNWKKGEKAPKFKPTTTIPRFRCFQILF